MGLTKLVLKRPVSTVLAILCLIVFGLSSVMKSPLELMPDMNMSMMIVMTVYPGASPDDVNELVTKPIEDRASTLSGLDTISSQSKENMSIVMLKLHTMTLKSRWTLQRRNFRMMRRTRSCWN